MIDTLKEKIIKNISPVIDPIAKINPSIGNLYDTTLGTLNQSGFPNSLFASQITTYKTAYPSSDISQNEAYVENSIIPQLEANKSKFQNTNTKDLSQALKEILNHPDALSDSPNTTIAAQLTKAGIPFPQSREIAESLITNQVDKISHAIADYSPISERSTAFRDILVNSGLTFIQEQPNLSITAKQSIATFIKDGPQIDPNKIYFATDKEIMQTNSPTQTSDTSLFQSPTGDAVPFVTHIFNNPIVDKLKSKAGNYALQKFVNSQVGKKVTNLAAKQLGKEVVKKAVTGLTTKAAAAATGVGLPITAILVAKDIIDKVISTVKKHFKEFTSVLAGLVAIPFLGIGGGILVTTGTFAGFSFFTGGVGFSSIGTRVGIIFNSLASNFITDNIIPIIIGVLSLPIIIAFFLIIINSGAYIVPPSARHSGPGGLYPSCWPLDSGAISSIPPHGGYNTLDAFDISTNRQNGFPVYATHDGVVHTFVDPHTKAQGSYGNYIKVVSSVGFCTLYGHLASFEVSDGTSVLAGDKIALSDDTGTSTGPHLHYEYQEPCQVYAGNVVGDNRILNYVPSGWTLLGSIQYPGSCFASQQGGSNTGP